MPRFSKKMAIILGLLVVIGLIALAAVTAKDREQISGTETVMRDAFTPAKEASSGLFERVASIFRYFSDSKNLQAENQALREEVAELRLKLDQMEDASVSNAYLKEMLGLQDEIEEWEPIATTVIGRSADAWFRTIIIKGGMNKGFEKDMPVITTEGLVGRILSVSQYSSEVLLLTDKDCAVGAVIRVSQTPGVVEGDGESDRVHMVHIPADTLITKDQVVVTSGLGGIFPAGLRIGYVLDVEPDAGELMQKATVQLYADFDRIKNVFVLTKIPEYALNSSEELTNQLLGIEENPDGDPGEGSLPEGEGEGQETPPEGE